MIDWTRVNELRNEIGDDGFSEVVELFLDEVEEVIARLENAPDPRSFEQDLHFLKGSAWNLGFAAFGVLCQSGERRAAQGQAATVDMAAVLASYAASKDCFLAGLAKLTAGQTPDAA
ncbi:MAG TPA: Hpt domain-containing protein [Paracoccaceae bacterium]|nr:Hpt domain-containing protein [Paracoccaceae bacterium]